MYPGLLRIINLFISDQHHCVVSLLCVINYWVFLAINGYLPLVYNYMYNKSSISYPLDSNLADNLFLFLSDEKCCECFDMYIQRTGNQRASLSLSFYTDCMSFRLMINLNYSKEEIIQQGKLIVKTYFKVGSMGGTDDNVKLFEADVIHKELDTCRILKDNEYNKDMFDEGIEVAFENLEEAFSEYKLSSEHKALLEIMNKESEFQCKMAIAGLVKNK